MMAQVERRAAANSAKIEQARGHALFALDVAVGRLQSEAGPDQRISARAEILDDTPATTNVTGVNQPYWTGIWRTGTNQLDVGASPQRQISLGSIAPTKSQIGTNAAWLVSGTNANPLTFVGTTNGAARNAVALAAGYGATRTNVIVPLVPVVQGTTTNGAYGYWVSDEGVKAKVTQTSPTLGASTIPENQMHLLAPQANHAGKGLLGSSNTADLRALAPSAGLDKVSTLASLQNVAGVAAGTVSGTNAAAFAADATTHGAGVLADVRRGGLKKDLTAAFENGAAFNTLTAAFGFGDNMVYRSSSSAGITVPTVDTGVNPAADGLHWFSLYGFYNSYKAQMPLPPGLALNGSPLTPTSAGNPSTLPGSFSPRAYVLNLAGADKSKLGNMMPVPVAYRVDIALSSYQVAGMWRLRIHYYPQLVLWNPYSVRLNYSTYQFQRNVGAFATAGSPASITVTVGGTALAPVVLNQASGGRLILKTKVGDCATLEPGETRVFALDADLPKSDPLNAINFTDLVSNPSMSADFSQFCDLPGFAGTADGASPVAVSLSDRRLRCQNVDTFLNPSGLKWPWSDGSIRVNASGGWDIAATATTWSSLQIQQMDIAPRRIIGFYVRLKGLLGSSSTKTYSNAGMNVPIFSGNAGPVSPLDDNFSYAWQEVYLSPLGTLYQNGETDVQIAPSGTYWETSVGAQSAGVNAPGTRRVLRDVPALPMLSPGQFMHMPAIFFQSIGVYQQFVMGSGFVGGSLASPIMPTDRNAQRMSLGTASGGVPNSKLFLDDSFLANEALFDRFYFSTIPPQALNAPGTTYPAAWTDFNAANAGAVLTDPGKPLLNARIRPVSRNGQLPAMADLRDVDRAAGHVMVDGAFNINSTSVQAWKAFLASMSGNSARLWNATTRSADVVSTSGGTPFSRFWSASGLTAANQPWSGLRVLDDAELEELAGRIVEQVKLRGPFLSMADFLNRRLGSAGPLTRCGALQAAIDATTPDINSAAKAAGATVNAVGPQEAGKTPDLITANMLDGAGQPWNTALGIPGYLMQQDLVQACSPGMSARSDTFLVRTYGEVRNPRSGSLEGRAWCEAVVQRLPVWADASQDAEIDPASANAVNAALGRKFRVVSFRWLNDNEI